MVGSKNKPILLVLLLAWATSKATAKENKYCSFNETVDLVDCKKLSNGSYAYEGLLILPESIAVYNEIMQNGSWVKVPEHKRGCKKPYIKFCCSNMKASLNTETGQCQNELQNYTYTPKVNIAFEDGIGKSRVLNDFNGFIPRYGLPCCYVYSLSPEETETDMWSLNQNGSVYIDVKKNYLDLDKYCLHPDKNTISDEYVFKAYICPTSNELTTFQELVSIIMVISAVSMILTVLIYLFLGKRTNHQILFLFYLICLSVSFIAVVINNEIFISNILLCYVNGYIGYFAVMAAFFLLTVICVCMWNNFRTSNFYATNLKSKTQLYIGLLVSFGAASFLALVVLWADNSSIHEDWKPRVGEFCWINTSEKATVYLYGPMVVLLLINLVMFILTSARIINLKKEVSHVKNSKNFDSLQKRLSFGKEFGLYLRILLTMGTTWIFEIIASSVENDILDNISNFINAIQGIIIFFMFGNVQLILKRFIGVKTSDTEDSSTQISVVRQTSTSSTASTKRLLHGDNV